jgi:hypothetical protein
MANSAVADAQAQQLVMQSAASTMGAATLLLQIVPARYHNKGQECISAQHTQTATYARLQVAARPEKVDQ